MICLIFATAAYDYKREEGDEAEGGEHGEVGASRRAQPAGQPAQPGVELYHHRDRGAPRWDTGVLGKKCMNDLNAPVYGAVNESS